jgi:5-(carboxyamino)imidazole ribonucleotide synthase
MKRVWVLGAGQLGAMLRYSGQPLGLEVVPIDIDHPEPPPLESEDLITAEREQWPDTETTRLLATHPGFVNNGVFARLADRKTQKQILDELGIATSPWFALERPDQLDRVAAQLGHPALLKRRTGGYDGRGQLWLEHSDQVLPADWFGTAIAEQKIPFEDEVSVIGARNRAGEMYFYPLSLNLHQQGILMASISPVERIGALQQQAETMLARLMQGLEYVGVMAMECFRVGDKLLVNEVAPRVHNSGHWTLAGSSCSQFEMHLRTVVDLPLGSPVTKGQTLMINLIGTELDPDWLSLRGAELWWYDKEVRPGRKVGHINFCDSDGASPARILPALEAMLPTHYGPVLKWAKDNLAA